MRNPLREHRRRRELRKWFRVRYYRDRHEVYLRILATMRMVREHRAETIGAAFWHVSGLTVKAALFLAPGEVEADSAMVADMISAMRMDGLVQRTHLPPEGTVERTSTLHARYNLTADGEAFLDRWWVRETLARFRPLPDPAQFDEIFVVDV